MEAPDMGTVFLDEARSLPLEVIPLSIERYHHMRDAGILDEDEPVELLEGLLVRKDRGGPMAVSPLHALVTSRLMGLAPEIEAHGGHLRVQNPITIPPSHEPEPDAAIVRGRCEAFLEHHPFPADVLSVIEVADTSLSRDRTTKQRIYAAAGVPQYVIINLVDHRIEVYEQPSPGIAQYATIRFVQPEETVALRVSDEDTLAVPASHWLP
jgi:Uma2 family endonuclease